MAGIIADSLLSVADWLCHIKGHPILEFLLLESVSMVASEEKMWQGDSIPSSLTRIIFRMRSKGCVLREIASAVGYSREAVRLVLKLDGRFPPRVPYHKKPAKLCKIRGCKRKHRGHGYCDSHLGKLKRGTIDENGRAIPVPRTCRLCGRPFYVSALLGNRKMCHRCRPPLPEERSSFEEIALRHQTVLQFYRRGTQLPAISRTVGLSVSTVRAVVRESKAQKTSPKQKKIDDGLCVKCGGMRNKSAFYCDGCHEVLMVKQRERLRKKYKQVPRCNAIGCRFKPVLDGFCQKCHTAWENGTIDAQGKHLLVTCTRCPCRFIPSRENQKLCLNCD
jgi:lambda repressor-like predicted transcriptional regulator